MAGTSSPKPADYPAYMDRVGENARGIHAVRVLSGHDEFTLDTLIAAAYDPDLPAFDVLLPPLFEAYRSLPAASELRAPLSEPIALLQAWDRRWAADSVATTVAIHWAEELWRVVGADPKGRAWPLFEQVASSSTSEQRLQALLAATEKLQQDFGHWRMPWGRSTASSAGPATSCSASMMRPRRPRWLSPRDVGARWPHLKRARIQAPCAVMGRAATASLLPSNSDRK